jgi:membrane protease YdiL (CAAX protease family)
MKQLADEFAVVHLVNFYILIFREEFFSRGLIQTKAGQILDGKLFHISLSVWFSTLIFSLWHLVNLPYFPVQTVLIQILVAIPTGLLVGMIKERTGNTLITYLLHLIADLLFLSCYLLIAGTPFLPLF